MQVRMRFAGSKIEILCSTFGIKAQRNRYRLEQSRFSAAVLTDEVGNLGMELETVKASHSVEIERIFVKGRNLRSFERDVDDILT